MRSMTDEYYETLRSRDPQRVETLRSRVQELRTPPAPDAAPIPSGQDGTRGTSDADGAATLPEAPNPDSESMVHPTGMSPAQRARALRELALPFLKETA
jgi:hypothetical protein